jgi:hypothetical protein
MRKVLLVWCLMVLILGTVGNGVGLASNKEFKDVASNYWAKKEIEYLTSLGIIAGYQNGHFGINDHVKRGQAAVMVTRALKLKLGDGSKVTYKDVKGKHWAQKEIEALVREKIFSPKGTTFQPEKSLTRGEMAAILVNAYKLTADNVSSFKDVPTEHPYVKEILILAANGITTGYEDGTFKPNQPVTRTQFAVFFSRVLNEEFLPGYEKQPEVDQNGNLIVRKLTVDGKMVTLDKPFVLRNDHWYAPVHILEKIGFAIQGTEAVMVKGLGMDFEIKPGKGSIWLGSTHFTWDQPVIKENGTLIIPAFEIIQALGFSFVYFPDEQRIEIKGNGDVISKLRKELPQSLMTVLHKEVPYWQWTKKDQDYLAKQQLDGTVDPARLSQEMSIIMDAYAKTEKERVLTKGMIFYGMHVNGKLDALSRGIEARYRLLKKVSTYQYPVAGESGAIGGFWFNNMEYSPLVTDNSYRVYVDEDQNLLNEIQKSTFNFAPFQGLVIHGNPFSIRTKLSENEYFHTAGMAAGKTLMMVVNSSVGTFYHELGHNWADMYLSGDYSEYLTLRNKADYEYSGNTWESLVTENFAEDFAHVFGPIDSHRAVFGEPSLEIEKKFEDWALTKMREAKKIETLELNGMYAIPKIIVVSDGKLSFKGDYPYPLTVSMKEHNGKETEATIQIHPDRVSSVQLPQKGEYEIAAGLYVFKVVY